MRTISLVTPILSYRPFRTNFPKMTPMEPVIVWGWATIVFAASEIQYPPDAATSDMETTRGFFWASSSASRRMTSEAAADPPGESTRRTTAFTAPDLRHRRSCSARVSEPSTSPPNSDSPPEAPVLISPEAKMTATFFSPRKGTGEVVSA